METDCCDARASMVFAMLSRRGVAVSHSSRGSLWVRNSCALITARLSRHGRPAVQWVCRSTMGMARVEKKWHAPNMEKFYTTENAPNRDTSFGASRDTAVDTLCATYW